MDDFPKTQHGVIYVDPPWSYTMRSPKGYEKSPDAHYPCMGLGELKKMRELIDFAALPDCVLFMWGVFPMVPDALELIKAWGFAYKTGGAWHKKTTGGKDAFGTGYIFRSAAEPFFVATLGNPSLKNKSTRNIVEAPVREHSRKPDCVYELIENLWDGPYLELFARTRREGWTAWGNEVGCFDDQKKNEEYWAEKSIDQYWRKRAQGRIK
jgi:N6-adenosine-specific RNA methylase IME4